LTTYSLWPKKVEFSRYASIRRLIRSCGAALRVALLLQDALVVARAQRVALGRRRPQKLCGIRDRSVGHRPLPAARCAARARAPQGADNAPPPRVG